MNNVERLSASAWSTRLSRLALLIGLATVVAHAHATDLLGAWQGARDHDPALAEARAAAGEGQTQRDQARALWRPNVVVSGSVGVANASTSSTGAQFSAPRFGQSSGVDFQTSVNHGNAMQWSVSAVQPVYNPERRAQSGQLQAAANATDVGLRRAEQDALLRTASRYFDVILAEQALTLIGRQRESVERALVEARDRYRIGDRPITDSHEAEARAQAVIAEQLAAAMQRDLAVAAFRDQTGLEPADLMAPGPDSQVPLPGSLDLWIDKAIHRNPTLQQRELAIEVAREEVAKYRAGSAPTLDLVAQSTNDRLSGGGDYGPARNSASRQFIGLQLTVPLYTGGMRDARHEQALRKVEQAEAQLVAARQQVTRETRAAWLGLQASTARLKALEAGRRASDARLDATRLGYTVGDRTTLDRLNAENDATAAELALMRGRVERLMNVLQLAAAAGELDEQMMALVDRQLTSRKSE